MEHMEHTLGDILAKATGRKPMIDIAKPLAVKRGLRTTSLVEYVANAQGKIIVRYPLGGLTKFDEVSGMSPSGQACLENVPVTHRRLVCLYNIRGSIGACAFVDEASLKSHFMSQPGLVIASKWVDIVEGESVFTSG